VLTIFSTARAFKDLYAVIQRNAMTSWSKLEPRPEVLVFGDDDGTAEICAELGFVHIPEVATSDLGTPLVSDMFAQAQQRATNPFCCFVNSDIILLPKIYEALNAAASQFDEFLIVGRRVDLDITEVLDFGTGWSDRLRRLADESGRLQPEIAIDYFIFPRGSIGTLPPFAIGRGAYDNWLIWHAGDQGLSVIDASPFFTVIHQSHDYSHAGGLKAVWEGPEAQQARALVGHWSRYHTVSHAQHMIAADGTVGRARGATYRLARPRRVASHLLRFSRPLRRWMKYDAAYALRTKARVAQRRAVAAAAQRLAAAPETEPVPVPEWSFGHADRRDPRVLARLWLWRRAARLDVADPVLVRWYDGLVVAQHLGNDTSRCLFVGGRIEPNEMTFVARAVRPGAVVIDAGASEGLFTMLASRRAGSAGRVVAVEPSPREHERLGANVARNSLGNVTVVREGLLDEPGDLVLHVAESHHDGRNTFGEFVYDIAGEDDVKVPVTTLDELVLRLDLKRVDLVKIDVEGAELRLLQGATTTLRAHHPVLLFELQDASLRAQGSSAEAVLDLLAGFGYCVLPFSRETGVPTAARQPDASDLNVVGCHVDDLDALVAAGAVEPERKP